MLYNNKYVINICMYVFVTFSRLISFRLNQYCSYISVNFIQILVLKCQVFVRKRACQCMHNTFYGFVIRLNVIKGTFAFTLIAQRYIVVIRFAYVKKQQEYRIGQITSLRSIYFFYCPHVNKIEIGVMSQRDNYKPKRRKQMKATNGSSTLQEKASTWRRLLLRQTKMFTCSADIDVTLNSTR